MDRNTNADLLRVFATIAVVLLHVASSKWAVVPSDSLDWIVFTFYCSFVRWCVPVFIMLSGMFFLDPKKNVRTVDLFRKYIPRLLTALFFWGIFYGSLNLVFQIARGRASLSFETVGLVFGKVLLGPPWYHLWYLYLIVGLYFITPVIRVFVQASSRRNIEYALGLFFCFGLLLPCLNYYLKFKFNTSVYLPMNEISGYAGYYLTGYYLARYDLSAQSRIRIYFLGVLSIIVTGVGTYTLNFHSGMKSQFYFEYLLPTTFFVSCSVFLLIIKEVKFSFSDKLITIITSLANTSFGIYLIHDLFIQILVASGISTTSFSSVLSVPILTLSIFSLSVVAVKLLKKVLWLKRYVV